MNKFYEPSQEEAMQAAAGASECLASAKMKPEGPPVNLELTPDEALVLFEWLSKRDDDDAIQALIEHWSEQLVLWSLLAQLEKTLAKPFAANYHDLLAAARERLVVGIAPEDRKRVK